MEIPLTGNKTQVKIKPWVQLVVFQITNQISNHLK